MTELGQIIDRILHREGRGHPSTKLQQVTGLIINSNGVFRLSDLLPYFPSSKAASTWVNRLKNKPGLDVTSDVLYTVKPKKIIHEDI